MKWNSDYNCNDIKPDEYQSDCNEKRKRNVSKEEDGFETIISKISDWDNGSFVAFDGSRSAQSVNSDKNEANEAIVKLNKSTKETNFGEMKKNVELIELDEASEVGNPFDGKRSKRGKLEESVNSIQKPMEKFQNFDVPEKILKLICKMVGELFESMKMIQRLEREMNENVGLEDHFKKVIFTQREKFRKDIWKNLETILNGYDQMLRKSSSPRDVALKISKATRLTVEEVEYVISGCIQLEDKCRREKEVLNKSSLSGRFTDTCSGGDFCVDYSMSLNMIREEQKVARTRERTRTKTRTLEGPARVPQGNNVNPATSDSTSEVHRESLENLLSGLTSDRQRFSLPPQSQNSNPSSSLIHYSNSTSASVPTLVSSRNAFQCPSSQDQLKNLLSARNGRPTFPSNGVNFINDQNRLYPVSIADIHEALTSNRTRTLNPSPSSSSATFASSNGFPSEYPFAHKSTPTTRSFQAEGNQFYSRLSEQPVSGHTSRGSRFHHQMSKSTQQRLPFPPVQRSSNLSNHPQQFLYPRNTIPQTGYGLRQPFLSQVASSRNSSFRLPDFNLFPDPSAQRQQNSSNSIATNNFQNPSSNFHSSVCPNLASGNSSVTTQSSRRSSNRSFSHSGFSFTRPKAALPQSQSSIQQYSPNSPEKSPPFSFLAPTNASTCLPSPVQTRAQPPSLLSSLLSTSPATLPPSSLSSSLAPAAESKSADGDLLSTESRCTEKHSTDSFLVIHDPTIPQKLTLKDQRLQAGDALEDAKGSLDEPVVESTEEIEVIEDEYSEELLFVKKEEDEIEIIEESEIEEVPRSRVRMCAQTECVNIGVRICKGCNSVIYCSDTCQLKHWRLKHKEECNKLKELLREE